jgi:hypothetical protein
LGNQIKKQIEREKVKAAVKRSKQSTLDNISYQFNIERREGKKPIRSIIIDAIDSTVKEDELELKTDFRLLPSKDSFSKINLDLYFEEQLLNSTTLCLPQSILLNEALNYAQVLDMRGISEGNYMIRVEMYEPWGSEEKLSFAAKEIAIQYIPQTRESRLVKIPTVKSVAGSGLTFVSSNAKNIYSEIEQDLKMESLSKRDEW